MEFEMTDENFDNGYIRSRRNVILLSIFILIYCSGAVFFKEDIQILGLELQRGRERILLYWLCAFHLYFLWRFWNHWRGRARVKTMIDVLKKRTIESFFGEAKRRFRKEVNLNFDEGSFYTSYANDSNIPAIKYTLNRSYFTIEEEKATKELAFLPERNRYRKAFCKQALLMIICDIEFSENIFPYILWTVATIFLVPKVFLFAPM